jgi:hypothetical protein
MPSDTWCSPNTETRCCWVLIKFFPVRLVTCVCDCSVFIENFSVLTVSSASKKWNGCNRSHVKPIGRSVENSGAKRTENTIGRSRRLWTPSCCSGETTCVAGGELEVKRR